MASRSRKATVAVTGLAAGDNPAPGLAVARSLRAVPNFQGRLVGLTFDHRFTGAYAPYFDHVHLIPPPTGGERAYFQALAAIARIEHIDVLVPTLDPEALLGATLRSELAQVGVRTILPDDGAIRRAAKMMLPRLVGRAGFQVPRTFVVTSRATLESALRALTPPFYLKGSFADAVLVAGDDDAHTAFARLSARWGLPLLAQERIVGDELNLAVLYDRRHRRVGAVPMRKLGVTVEGKAWAGITLETPDLMGLADRLMAELAWTGAAELEVIRDRTSGAYFLIEVNPRFPAWIYLSAAAGVNLPWAAVRLALGERVASLADPQPGLLFTRTTEDHFVPSERAEHLAGAAHGRSA